MISYIQSHNNISFLADTRSQAQINMPTNLLIIKNINTTTRYSDIYIFIFLIWSFIQPHHISNYSLMLHNIQSASGEPLLLSFNTKFCSPSKSYIFNKIDTPYLWPLSQEYQVILYNHDVSLIITFSNPYKVWFLVKSLGKVVSFFWYSRMYLILLQFLYTFNTQSSFGCKVYLIFIHLHDNYTI